ncbi:MAG: HEAT repeat domain-containing protein [Acidobacteria bacterium]|nr:HEAT repeat domain-containing protein [Acidobacteriota bacterium]MCI0723528.1 HEAT repeat domain-containing protein [Acidobacteriota bacterium]
MIKSNGNCFGAWWRIGLTATVPAVLGIWVFATVSAEGRQQPSRKLQPKVKLILNQPWKGNIPNGKQFLWQTDNLDSASLYTLSMSLGGVALPSGASYTVSLEGPGKLHLSKRLHAGDPSLFVTFRPKQSGPGVVRWRESEGGKFPASRAESGSIQALLKRLEVTKAEETAFEAEPNNSWQEANSLELGRTVYGGSDDIEYLDNKEEYNVGWDYFRIDFEEADQRLVFFELDLPDRDIPLQLLFYRFDPATQSIEPYVRGKDPMEVLHDGQKVRYSKFITRVLTKGRYYLAVLGNHPFYQLRTTAYPVPPLQDPRQAVETAMHYMANIGDAWFAQIPRLGARYRRSVMMHDEAQRCTACHPTVFPLESNLVAFQKGYPIRAKSQFQYLMNRVYNAPTPLYGNPGVNWVRFVAIQLQFFGKQGGLVLDYENSVTGRKTPFLGRYTGFLQAAWDHRDSLPPDEKNGVSPIDSKFGFGWRDWRVLDEMARRTDDPKYRASADHIEALLTNPESITRLEGTQDRLHRLHAMAVMNHQRYSPEIEQSIRYFVDRQNPDGGWPGNDEKGQGGEKSVESKENFEYLTGQTIYTLAKAGVDDPTRAQLEKGAGWLLSRQREFGGWFQTETIENFVTPMRETRYAIMALATLYPRGPRAGLGLGNRDEKPARLPRVDALLHTLDDLDNIWQIPEGRRHEFDSTIHKLLRHDDALVRALAAQCLGRIGESSSVEPLVERLNDPVKMVWQSASWALRQLGNRKIGVGAIRAALSSPDPATRRGATRVLAYQFYGMDDRSDLRDALYPLLTDSDLLTRHQAVATLSQWFYRTVDRKLRGQIVQAFVSRLGDPKEDPVQRSYLSQGIYNLLDENLGNPGTGYGRWIDYLKPEQQAALRAERKWQEQEILINPLLTVLQQGPAHQRLGVLMGFDGIPFSRGYTTAASGPGNDRAFDFERKKEFEGLEPAFAAVLSRQDKAEELSYGLRLGAFFDVLQGEPGKRLAPLYLNTLLHRDPSVRAAALDIAEKVSLKEIQQTDVTKLVQASQTEESKKATLKLLRSNPQLLEQAPLTDLVRGSLADEKLSALTLPLLANSRFDDKEVETVLVRFWPQTQMLQNQDSESARELQERNTLLKKQVLEESGRRYAAPPPILLDCVQLIDKRPNLMNQRRVMELLSKTSDSESPRIRQLVMDLFAKHPSAGDPKFTKEIAQDALSDTATEVRRSGLKLTSLRDDLWKSPRVHESLLRLLVDSDVQVRRAALDLVGEKKLIGQESRLAGRVKALEAGEKDMVVRQKANAVLREAGLSPSEVKSTADLSKPVEPDYETFRKMVNPYFYQVSAKDNNACANCHATHRILRLAEPPEKGKPIDEHALKQNYQSLLKVIDVYEPESSLVLRKPRSPSGQEENDPASPTGLTHVGGTRWSGTDDPAYLAILQWIRAAGEEKTSRLSAPR